MEFESDKIILDFSVKKCEKNRIYQILIESEDKSLGLKEKFKTEELICNKDNSDIIFKNTLTLNFNFTRKQKLIIICVKKGERCSNRHTDFSSIVTSPNAIYERPFNEYNKNKDIFCICANRIKEGNESKDTIFDFLKSGIKLNVFIAYDFSQGINKKPRIMSLKNYSCLTQSIIIPMQRYLKGHSLYFYGYGGIKENSQSNDDLFNLFSQNDEAIPLEKAIKYMSNPIQDIKKINNTVFLSKLIRKITDKIYKLYELRNFNVLFILAKELPDKKDKQELIDSIIESSYLPLIIIIIGEGSNDFNMFQEYFGKKIKRASNGMEKNRDNILYFTSEGNELSLAPRCLNVISKNILEYYQLSKCKPEQIWENNMESIMKSYINYKNISVCIFESYLGKSKSIVSIIKEGEDENIDIDKNKIIISNKEQEHNNNINNINNYIRITPGESINDIDNVVNTYKDKNYVKKNTSKKVVQKEIEKIEQKSKEREKEKLKEKEKDKDKDKDKETTEAKYIITPGQSICTFLPNPYNKENKEEEQNSQSEDKRCLIPNESVATSIVNNDNPYNIGKKDQKQYKDSKVDSSTSTIENSKFGNIEKNKGSNLPNRNMNYSIDNI